MRTRVLVVAAAVTASVLAGCGGTDDAGSPTGPTSGSPSAPAASTPPEPQQLPLGKSVVPLQPDTGYRSPEGFAPPVVVQPSADGWVSTHRSADAFDVSRPLPDVDAALVVVAFMVPGQTSAEAVRQAVTARAEAAGATVEPDGDSTLVVTGGDGPLVASRDGGIALDAVPGGYSRITVSDTDAGPSVMVFWVPDATHRDEAEQAAQTIAVTPVDH
jgi:hypothetical protein